VTAETSGHPGQLWPTHCWKATYSVTAPTGAAASHVGKHETSFARHWVTTQLAIEMHAGSFGQLDGPLQQLVATHETQLGPGTTVLDIVKIWAAPGQVVEAIPPVVPASGGGAGMPWGPECPPPFTGVPHGTSDADVHAAGLGGRSVLEHASTPAASSGTILANPIISVFQQLPCPKTGRGLVYEACMRPFRPCLTEVRPGRTLAP
jgi:hypothetical protein